MDRLYSWGMFIVMLVGLFASSTQTAWSAQSSGQEKWDQTLRQAKKEGTVSIYVAGWGPSTRTAIAEAFKSKYGINVEFTAFGRGAEMAARVEKEKSAGLKMVDVFSTGSSTLISIMKPIRLLGKFEPLLILPEVTDLKPWRGKLPYIDKDKTSFAMTAAIQRYVMYNTGLVRKGEITSYKDLLKPQYEGKITLNDPTSSGSGNGLMTFLAQYVWNLQQAEDFLTQLIRQQKVMIQRDNRLHVESVARGKYAIGLAPWPDVVTGFLKAGAPLDVAFPDEGTIISSAAGSLSVPTTFSHPNAARIFVNWLLTKEGQTVLAKSYGYPSLRADVPTEGTRAAYLPQGKEKLFVQDEEYITLQGRMMKITSEVIKAARE